MKNCQQSFRFYERLGIYGWVIAYMSGRFYFYNVQSFPLRQLCKLFRRMSNNPVTRIISHGDVEHSPGLRGTAYALARQRAEEIACEFIPLAKAGNAEFGIDMTLVIRKFLVETLYSRYAFYNLAKQYIAEHPDCTGKLVMQKLKGDDVLSGISRWQWHCPPLSYLAELLVMPFYQWAFLLKHSDQTHQVLEDALICNAVAPKILNTFLDLFNQQPSLSFVTEPVYLANFTPAELMTHKISPHRLGKRGTARLKQVTRLFQREGWHNFRRWSRYGSLYFELYRTIVRGILQTVDAKRSTYFTYEHLSTTKAVRNEFMHADGNKTVFLPYGTCVEGHNYAPCFQYNYDILCSPCELEERVYKLQQARTNIILRTGPYEPHKATATDPTREERIRSLRAFKGDATTITILSSGIQDETRSVEVKLMAFARQLALQTGVRVLIRPKTAFPPGKYHNFYIDACANIDNMMLTTGSDYQLIDFLPVTDLFVTAYSFSAPDLCAAGGTFFCINFQNDEPFSLWESAVEGVRVSSDSAFETIMSWVNDCPAGQRMAHTRRMEELRQLLAFRFGDFDDYKQNLLEQLSPFLPAAKD